MPKESKAAYKNLTFEKRIPNFLKAYYSDPNNNISTIHDKTSERVPQTDGNDQQDDRPEREDEKPVVVEEAVPKKIELEETKELPSLLELPPLKEASRVILSKRKVTKKSSASASSSSKMKATKNSNLLSFQDDE